MSAIRVDGVSKLYDLGAGRGLFRDWLAAPIRALGGCASERRVERLWALRDISFDVQAGESVALIGPNGAGKTTMLKVLSRVTQPTVGSVAVEGRLSALIELGAGFHPDLSGRENVYLNGTILGLRRREIDRRFDAIVSFAELERFIDTPVKRYSTGMYARLGFAVAAHIEPDVLLVDEVLSVGDMAFQAKCYQRMHELRRMGTTLVFVSHNPNAVQQVCSRGIVFFRGQIAYDGSAAEAVAEYSSVLRRASVNIDQPGGIETQGLSQRHMTHTAHITAAELQGSDGSPTRVVRSGETVRAVFEVAFMETAHHPVFACTIRDKRGEVVYDVSTRTLGVETPSYAAGSTATVAFTLHTPLLNGVFGVTLDAAAVDLSHYYDYALNILSFAVTNGDDARGMVNMRARVAFSHA